MNASSLSAAPEGPFGRGWEQHDPNGGKGSEGAGWRRSGSLANHP